jgi:hypothetical protein
MRAAADDKDRDSKKQIPLRLSAPLWEELQRWAADEFRSVNGQIEYLLTECVKKSGRVMKKNDDGPA